MRAQTVTPAGGKILHAVTNTHRSLAHVQQLTRNHYSNINDSGCTAITNKIKINKIQIKLIVSHDTYIFFLVTRLYNFISDIPNLTRNYNDNKLDELL